MEALIVPRNPETEALLRRFSSTLTELRTVKSQLETLIAERDALRNEVEWLKIGPLDDARKERDALREEVARLREQAAILAEGIDGMPPRHRVIPDGLWSGFSR